MAKIVCKEFPKPIKECITKPHVDVIKTRKGGKDTYIYEISAKGVKPFVLDPKHRIPAGKTPELEDTWCGGKWPGKTHNGCDYDLNLFDKSICGGKDDELGIGATIYSCVQEGDYPCANTDDGVSATVKCWFQDENGKRTEFKYNIPDNYLNKFGEWDGTPIHLVKRPTEEVIKGALEIANKLKEFLKKNNLEIHYEMASDTVYMLPEENGWDDAKKRDVRKAMKASGKILNPRTWGKKWGWVRGSELGDNWFCKKGGK